jgi:hypothetical protein
LVREAGVLQLIVGPSLLRKCDNVVHRKVRDSLPILAYLLALGMVETANRSTNASFERANALRAYKPDAYILAEAMGAKSDWFITMTKFNS